MHEETFAAKIIHLVVFVAICILVISIGWKEPLRYRFMSPEQIAAAEGRIPTPPPAPSTPFEKFDGEDNLRLNQTPRSVRGSMAVPAPYSRDGLQNPASGRMAPGSH